MEEVYGPDPVQVPAAGLWMTPPALGFAITQMIRAGLLDADLDAIGRETASRRLELAKSKSASEGRASIPGCLTESSH
jgi:hypothetical protein